MPPTTPEQPRAESGAADDQAHDPPRDKAWWRARITAQRAAVPGAQHATEAAALTRAATDLAGTSAVETVCCYMPFGTEPGTAYLLDALRGTAVRVLLPVVPDRPAPLDWAEYSGTDSLVPGPLPGLTEPGGQRLGPHAISEADLVLVPALAVDRRGIRLGRGAGFYDRSLGFTSTAARLLAVVRDDEVVDELPAEAHDVRLSGALTPARGAFDLPAP